MADKSESQKTVDKVGPTMRQPQTEQDSKVPEHPATNPDQNSGDDSIPTPAANSDQG